MNNSIQANVGHRPLRRMGRRLLLPFFSAIWFASACLGLSWMWAYETTPGESSDALANWPADSRIIRNLDRPILVVFAHPRCPCTRATINELAHLVARSNKDIDIQVAFFKPESFDEDWEKTDLWHSASQIPGVNVICDFGGVEAQTFRATTSGHAMLYDADGRLLFEGGITRSRGHFGENDGRNAVERLIHEGESDETYRFPVFGCPLIGRDDAGNQESTR